MKDKIICTGDCKLCQFGELIKAGEVYSVGEDILINSTGQDEYICLAEDGEVQSLQVES